MYEIYSTINSAIYRTSLILSVSRNAPTPISGTVFRNPGRIHKAVIVGNSCCTDSAGLANDAFKANSYQPML
jgi:hypothetical protein